MKETTRAAVTEEGGGSEGHCAPRVWGGRLRRVDTLGGVKNFTVGTTIFI